MHQTNQATRGRVRSIAKVIAGLAILISALTTPYAPAGATSFYGSTYDHATGFHLCGNPSTAALQAWWANSPFYSIGLYVGGSNGETLGCTDLGTSKWQAAGNAGLAIHPYFYGNQVSAGCGGQYPSISLTRISLTPATAEAQGEHAADVASADALAHSVAGGGVIYFDFESFTNHSSSCIAAAQAFVRGWTHQMNSYTSYWAGVYGSSCGSALSKFTPSQIGYTLRYISPYDNAHSPTGVFGLDCLDDNLWNSNQRIHHTVGGVHKSCGGYAMTVDGDCLDGYTDRPGFSGPLSATCTKFW